MNCPRCKTNNPDDAIKCQHCGLKLKDVCPKCKTLNPLGQEKCINCNLRLLIFCPKCKTPNRPTQKNCRKCNYQILKQCTSCKAINPSQNKTCFKCGNEFSQQTVTTPQKAITSQTQENSIPVKVENNPNANQIEKPLDEYAAIFIEIINFAAIKAKIEQTNILQKIANKFYQLISIEAKKSSVKVGKISNQLLYIKFKNYRSVSMSSYNAVTVAIKIIQELDKLNYVIYKNFGLKLTAKIAAGIVTDQHTQNFCKQERNVATANDIVLSKEISKLLFNKFEMEKIGPILTNNGMMSFYKIKDIHLPVQELNQQSQRQQQPQQSQESEPKQTPIPEKKLPQEPSQENLSKKATDPISSYKELSQEEAFDYITKCTNSKKGEIIEISAPDGAGKSTLSNFLCQQFTQNDIIWLMGQCSPVNQFIPFAFIQDLLKTFFNLPVLVFNINESRKQVIKTLEAIGIKDKNIEKILFKLLFQENLNPDINEILNNKHLSYSCFNSILSALNARSRIVMFIDDFEFIDKSSLEYIKYLTNNHFLEQGNSIVINSTPQVDISKYFASFKISENLTSIKIKPFTREDTDNLILGSLNNQDILPAELKAKIYKNSNGLPLYIDQALWVLFQNNAIIQENSTLKFNPSGNTFLPENIDAIIQYTISTLNTISQDIMRLLSFAAILGPKFVPGILQIASGIEEDNFNNILNLLLESRIFIYVDSHNMAFKHKALWHYIFEKGISAAQKTSAHQTILEVFKQYITTNSANAAIHAELASALQDAAGFWNQAAVEALSVGDLKAYTMAQERIFLLIDNLNDISPEEKYEIKTAISEQLGKINYLISPKDGVKYLSNAINQNSKKNNVVKMIELSGYLTRSWEDLGKFDESISCIDNVIKKIDKNTAPMDFALLNYSKLESTFNLGRLEETIMIANNTVLPILNNYFQTSQIYGNLNTQELAYILLDTELILAKALAFQGNIAITEAAPQLINKASANGFLDIAAQAKISLELYNILQGKVNTLNQAIEYLNTITPNLKDSTAMKLYWDFINLIYMISIGNYEVANQISPQVIDLSQNSKQYNIASITKLLTGLALKKVDIENKEAASNIFYEELNYCSENKLATGALLGWYLIAKDELENKNLDKAQDIAEKALDVAQKASIKNILFSILLQQLLSEIKIAKNEFDMAQMFINQAYELAKKMNLYSLEINILLINGKMYHEMAKNNHKNDATKEKQIKSAREIYKKALELSQKIDNTYLITKVENSNTSLNILSNISGLSVNNEE